MRQLLLNLTDNAVKYSQPDGDVTLSLRRAGEAAEITVTNTGPGVTPEIGARVFDRFFRGDPAHPNAQEGCGLGLSISQWIATAHGGTISFDSKPEGDIHRFTGNVSVLASAPFGSHTESPSRS